MIQIYPTTESALSYSTYALKLPGQLRPIQPAPQKVSRTLSGGATVSRWAKNNEGATQSMTLTLSPEKYETLKTIVYHATVFEWVVVSKGIKYLATIDITAAEQEFANGNPVERVAVVFTIVQENYST